MQKKKGFSYDTYKVKRRVILGIAVLILSLLYAFKNFSFFIRASSTIAFLIVFYIIDYYFDAEFEAKHYLFVLAIAISSFLLSPLYYIYANYDKIQHFVQPILFSSIVFHLVSKLKIELKWKLTFTFFIIVGCLGIFEIGEYILDQIYNLNLQGVYIRDLSGLQKLALLQDRIDDTMIDIILGVIGAGIYSVITYFYLRKKA